MRTILACTLTMLLFGTCKQAYEPPAKTKNIRLLVVEGFINSGQGATTIHLSRTGDLQDQGIRPEYGAQVTVEGDDGSAFVLADSLNGKYSLPQLSINSNVKYRVHIITADGREYASDYTPVRYTPPVDTITWQREDNGLRLYVNTHDAQHVTKYFQWKYEETWEIHAAYYTSLRYLRDATNRVTALLYRRGDHRVDTTLYRCWRTLNSTSIMVGSTEKLATDVIYLPVQYIEPKSQKLSVLYSLYIKQYALSKDAYLFMQKMKKNTEQVGSLFDAQPSEISGNVKCLTDPNELVVGFVETTEEQTKRIFIYNNQVPDWGYSRDCVLFLLPNNLDTIANRGADLF
ncbi:MAG TPA: DUF4249 domain-containing protein, partial [Chitinophagaceae bacterium]|nr:DUF4249 domain-containing protein [Chitinophagaceae bacterium]